MTDWTGRAVGWAEAGWIPDPLLRWGIRRLCRQRLEEERRSGLPREERMRALVAALRASPVAVATDSANEQHYELPPDFFEAVLGRRLKYSACLFADAHTSLDEAEEAMLALTCERARIEDGMRVLDLGCGWGSLSLWLAERYPRCRVLAVSNSKDQREHILRRCARAGLSQVEVATADVNRFSPEEHGHAPGSFDRVVSVEMFEHVRNWELLLSRVAGWLHPGGELLLHFFCHRELAYLYEDRGQGDWMARNFFTGGMMPSEDLPRRFQRDLRVEEQWRVDGRHYERTSNAWLANLDRQRDALLPVLARAYGPRDAALWLRRWRLFFLACAELFGIDGGSEWFVSHTRMARPS
jgi:cyclopropane-fatty-acyl-phospholipid synthase